MMVMGCDPGLSGAIALYDPKPTTLLIFDMPVIPMPGGKKQINAALLANLIAEWRSRVALAIIEKVGAMPKQGISSAFNFGTGYGMLQGSLLAHKVPIRFITPQTWKKHYGLKADKAMSRTIATQRFPEYAHYFTRVKDDGRAEAALIALYGSTVFMDAIE